MFPTFDSDDFTTNNNEIFNESPTGFTPDMSESRHIFPQKNTGNESISDNEVARFKEKLNQLPTAKKSVLLKLGIASLAVGLLMHILFSVHNASKEAQQQSRVIQEAPLYQKDQQLIEAEANLKQAELAYKKVLTQWNHLSPVDPNYSGTLQSSMLNASQEIRRRIEELTRNRDSSNYGKNYLSALFSSLLTHRRIMTDPYLRGQIKEATLTIHYSDGTTADQYLSPEEIAAWSSVKDIIYIMTLEEVNYNIDFDEKLRIKKQLEDRFVAWLIQKEGLKGAIRPEEVMHDINHPWLDEVWNTEIAPTIDERTER